MDGWGYPTEVAADAGKKRLSYFTYQLLASKTDEPFAQQLGESTTGSAAVHVYRYQSRANGKLGLVAWADASATASLDWPAPSAQITSLITDVAGVPLRSEAASASGGKIAVSLTADPVWIAEAGAW
jgi:hypothetical protein